MSAKKLNNQEKENASQQSREAERERKGRGCRKIRATLGKVVKDRRAAVSTQKRKTTRGDEQEKKGGREENKPSKKTSMPWTRKDTATYNASNQRKTKES